MVVGTAIREQVRGEIVRMVHRGLGVPELARAVPRVLHRAVPFDGTCVLTVDPATLLPTGEIVQDGLPDAVLGRMTEIELGEPDVNKFAALARGPASTASLSAATGGKLDRSRRQRELRRPSGFGDELRSVLTGAGGPWGALTLLRGIAAARTSRRPRCGSWRRVAGVLADGLRQAALRGAAAGGPVRRRGRPAGARADGSVELANRAADRWLDELGADDRGLTGRGSGALRLPARRAAAGRAAGRPGHGCARPPGAGWWSAGRCSATGPTPRWRCCWRRPGRPSSPR